MLCILRTVPTEPPTTCLVHFAERTIMAGSEYLLRTSYFADTHVAAMEAYGEVTFTRAPPCN